MKRKKGSGSFMKIQDTLDMVDIPICLLDHSGGVILYNKAMKRFAADNPSVLYAGNTASNLRFSEKVSPKKHIKRSGRYKKTFMHSGKRFVLTTEPVTGSDGDINGFLYSLNIVNEANSRLEESGYDIMIFDGLGSMIYSSNTSVVGKITDVIKKPDSKRWSFRSLIRQNGLLETDRGWKFVTTISGLPKPDLYMRLEYDAEKLFYLDKMSFGDIRRFKSVFDDSPTFNLLLSSDGKIETANKSFSKALGYSLKYLSGKNFSDLVHPDSKDNAEKIISHKGALDTALPVSVITKNGRRKVIYFSRSMSRLKDGARKLLVVIGVDMTLAAESSRKLEEMKVVLETLVESLPDAVYLKDRKMRFLKVNRNFEEFFGMSRDKIIGKKNSSVFGKSAGAKNTRLEKECIGKGYPVKSHTVFNGRHIETVRVPVYDRSGNIDGLIGVSRDVTEDFEMNEELKASEKNYREMFDAAHDGVVVFRDDGLIMDANVSAVKMFGVSRGQISKASSSDFSYDDNKYFLKQIRLSIKGRPSIFEWKFRRNDGRVLWSEVSMRRVEVDKKYLCLALIRDITMRKKAETEVRESKEKYKTIFESSPEAILLVDNRGIVRQANRMIKGWLGYDTADILNLHVKKLPFLEKDAGKKMYDAFKERISGKKIRPIELMFRSRSGREEYGRVYGNPIKDKAGISADLMFISNITAQKKSEISLAQSEKKFRLAYENSLDAILWFDAVSSVIVNCNNAASRLFKYKKSDLIGMLFMNLLPDGKITFARRIFTKLKNSGADNVVCTVMTMDNLVRHVNISATLTMFDKRKIVQCIFKDITSQVEAQKAADVSRNTLERLMKNFPGMAYRRKNDRSWTMLIVSDGTKDLTGYSPGKFRGDNALSYLDIIFPEDRGIVKKAVSDAVATADDFKVTYRIITSSGDVKWVFEQGTAIKEHGSVRYVEGFVFNITDRVIAENEIRQRNAELEKFNRFAIGRELKMIQLKNKISSLEKKLRRYKDG